MSEDATVTETMRAETTRDVNHESSFACVDHDCRWAFIMFSFFSSPRSHRVIVEENVSVSTRPVKWSDASLVPTVIKISTAQWEKWRINQKRTLDDLNRLRLLFVKRPSMWVKIKTFRDALRNRQQEATKRSRRNKSRAENKFLVRGNRLTSRV